MKIEKKYIPSSLYPIKSPYEMTPEYITIHNTANDASADNEYTYMTKTNASSSTGWHIVIDDIKAIYAVPLTRNSWNAGDGKYGTGNRKSIGIEICYSKSGGSRYVQAEENCVQLVASLLKQYGWGIDRIKKHQDWSGKYCPHRILAESRWDSFKERVRVALNGGVPSPTPTPDPNNNGIFKVGDIVRINTAGHYPYYVADDAQKRYGLYQVREDLNAGGETRFSWRDNGIPEKFVDIVDKYGNKTANSDYVHVKKGNKFVFNRSFRITRTVIDGGLRYYQMDSGLGDKYKFWVIGTYLYKI